MVRSEAVLVVDAYDPGVDAPPTRNSHWMAERHLELFPRAALLDGTGATRSNLGAEIDECAPRGLLFFGHGDAAHAYGSDGEPVLDRENIDLTRGRWCHVFACRTGVELPARAAHAGADCYVGYETSLIVEWDVEGLGPEVSRLFCEVVVAASRALASGYRTIESLKREVSGAIDALTDYVLEHPDEDDAGLQMTSQQLLDRMVVAHGAITQVVLNRR